jgi:hypothetical protein
MLKFIEKNSGLPAPQISDSLKVPQKTKERVVMGGHDVPAQIVLRRFDRGLNNLFHLYRSLFDSWMLFDNSAKEPVVIAKETNGGRIIFDEKVYTQIRENVGAWMKKPSEKEENLDDLPLDIKAEKALKEAVAEAIAEHKLRGRPIVIWRDGKVVTIPPEEISVNEPTR